MLPDCAVQQDVPAETVFIQSVDDMMKKKGWSNFYHQLSGEGIWRAKARDPIVIANCDNFVLDGGGVTLYGNALILDKCKNATLRNLTVRLGGQGFKAGDVYEALSLKRCNNVRIENCSLSWGTDETFAVVDCKDIEIINCLIAEGLDEPKDKKGKWLHPEKHKHGYGLLIRGSQDVLVDGCLIARFTERSPSVSPKGKYNPDVSVTNCVIYNYFNEGSKFNDGGDGGDGEMIYKLYQNTYIADSKAGPAIEIDAPGKKGSLKVKVGGNVDDKGKPVKLAFPKGKKRITVKEKDLPRSARSVEDIVAAAGPRTATRSVTDQRLLDTVRQRIFEKPLKNETEVPEFGLYKALIKD